MPKKAKEKVYVKKILKVFVVAFLTVGIAFSGTVSIANANTLDCGRNGVSVGGASAMRCALSHSALGSVADTNINNGGGGTGEVQSMVRLINPDGSLRGSNTTTFNRFSARAITNPGIAGLDVRGMHSWRRDSSTNNNNTVRHTNLRISLPVYWK